jgi:hypothetical protein
LREPPPRLRLVPGYCLNHQEVVGDHTCADCGEAFCGNCVVSLQSQALCGPCKNHRIRRLHWPPRISVLGILALVAGIVGDPIAFVLCIIPMGMDLGVSGWTLALSIAGMVLPATAVVLGIQSLRAMALNARIGGRSLAMIGVVTGLAGVVWCLTVMGIVLIRLIAD